MSWRGLCISSPARLDLRAGRLLLRREGVVGSVRCV